VPACLCEPIFVHVSVSDVVTLCVTRVYAVLLHVFVSVFLFASL
jgi:hypothetical protein